MFLDNYKQFLEKIYTQLKEKGIDTHGFILDHIAYQARTSKDYENTKNISLKIANLIHEAIVDNRRVAAFKLEEPLEYNKNLIQAFELIEPTVGQDFDKGFLEHAEFIVPMGYTTLPDFYPNLDWDTKNIDREQFPMIKLKLEDGLQVKFPKDSVIKG